MPKKIGKKKQKKSGLTAKETKARNLVKSMLIEIALEAAELAYKGLENGEIYDNPFEQMFYGLKQLMKEES